MNNNNNYNSNNNAARAVQAAIKRKKQAAEESLKRSQADATKLAKKAEAAVNKANTAIDNATKAAQKAANMLTKQMSGTLATRRSGRVRKPAQTEASIGFRRDQAMAKRKREQAARVKKSRTQVIANMGGNEGLLQMMKKIKV